MTFMIMLLCSMIAVVGFVLTIEALKTTSSTTIDFPSCPTGLKTCATPEYPSIPQCHNVSAGQTCCGARGQDCVSNGLIQVCNKFETCCVPGYGCEYSGAPTCCPPGGPCCSSGQHGVFCGDPGDKCCYSFDHSGACPKDTTCCTAEYTTHCCTAEEKCCRFGANGGAQCCGVNQHCDGSLGCVSDSCTAKASVTVLGPVLHSAVVNSSDACCDLCAENAKCEAAVATLMKPSQSEKDAFLTNLVKHVTAKSRRNFLATAVPPAILCELKGSDAMVANVGTVVLTVQRK